MARSRRRKHGVKKKREAWRIGFVIFVATILLFAYVQSSMVVPRLKRAQFRGTMNHKEELQTERRFEESLSDIGSSADIERILSCAKQYTRMDHPSAPEIRAGKFSWIPTVVFAGKRYMYLEKVVEGLRAAYLRERNSSSFDYSLGKPICLFSFDIRLHMLVYEDIRNYCNAIHTASYAEDFCHVMVNVNINSDVDVDGSGHLHVKNVWMKTMKYVWDQALPYWSGDIVFLEDDVIPSPDYFVVVKHLSDLKNENLERTPCKDSGLHPQVFALGSWGGENTILATTVSFMQKTSQGMPTMGYGFNRQLWGYIKKSERRILEHPDNDWSGAVAESLVQLYQRFKYRDPECHELNGFHKSQQVEVYQPTLSRVWHIGRVSTVGSSHKVEDTPPWAGERLLDKMFKATLLQGRHDWFGFPCEYKHRTLDNDCTRQFHRLFPANKRHSIDFNPEWFLGTIDKAMKFGKKKQSGDLYSTQR